MPAARPADGDPGAEEGDRRDESGDGLGEDEREERREQHDRSRRGRGDGVGFQDGTKET